MPILAVALRRFGPIAACIAASLVLYREILTPAWVLSDYDIWVYFYPLRAYAARALAHGRFPLWNPDTFLGAPFFANPQTAVLYPGSVIFDLLPIGYAYSLSVILHVALAAMFMYAFLHVGWGLMRTAAFAGGCGFAFGGFISSQIGHVNQLSASAWLPAIVLCADMTVRRGSVRWTVAGALALAVQLFAGHAQESYMTVWITGIVMFWRLLSGPEPVDSDPMSEIPVAVNRPSWERLARGAVAGALLLGIGFGLAAIQLLPTAELSAAGIRGGGMSDAEALSFSLPPPSIMRSVLPGYWFNLGSEEIGYIGAIGTGFAAIALLFSRWRPTVCAAAIALLGLFFAVGIANPLYLPLLHHVPGLSLFRVPSRWLFVYAFGASSLAALGVDWAFGSGRTRVARQAPSPPPQPSPIEEEGGIIRVVGVGLILMALGLAGLLLSPREPGRIMLLWVIGFLGAAGFALAARRWPTALVGVALSGAILVELLFAAMDLPQRYPAPAEVLSSQRPVPTYLLGSQLSGGILSIAPTEYVLEDEAEIESRYHLAEHALFFFTSDLKLDAVMSPNVPLRYGLSSPDGYDGGVLPLRRYLQLASLLAPANELRADGVIRTRLIAVPDPRLWPLFNIRAVIASQAVDVELGGSRFDVATARLIPPGGSVHIEPPGGYLANAIDMLGSVEIADGATGEGRMTISHADGSVEDVPLKLGELVHRSTDPGALRAPQPTAGLSRGGRMDSAVRIPIASGSAITGIDWSWSGAGSLELRAATLRNADGSQEQLMLQPGLKRIVFPVLKVYEPTQTASGLPLFSTAEVADDDTAIDRMRSMSADQLSQTLLIAPDQAMSNASPSALESAPARFSHETGDPERLVFHRSEGNGGGYLMIPDAWFPGWKAQIDGVPAAVLRADVLFKAVFVPPGGQTVTLTYEPASLRWGAIVSAAFVVIAAGLFLVDRFALGARLLRR